MIRRWVYNLVLFCNSWIIAQVTVIFPAQNLEAAISLGLKQPPGDVQMVDLQEITTLSLVGKNVKSLKEIEHLSGLTNLQTANNEI